VINRATAFVLLTLEAMILRVGTRDKPDGKQYQPGILRYHTSPSTDTPVVILGFGFVELTDVGGGVATRHDTIASAKPRKEVAQDARAPYGH